MLVIAVKIPIHPATRAEVIERCTAVAVETMKEPGCKAYQFSSDINDPNTLFLFELEPCVIDE